MPREWSPLDACDAYTRDPVRLAIVPPTGGRVDLPVPSPQEPTTLVAAKAPVAAASTALEGITEGRLGRYDLIGRLGQGGMAEVFLAVSTSPVGDVHKLVVIKRVRETLRDDADFIRMFLDEARISARINHPNVVHTYAVEVEDGVPLIVMEYLDGVPLQAIAKRLADRPWQERLPLVWALTQALIGLHYVHEFCDYDGLPLGLVHRDIKPGNIFVTFEGQVKVLDFGIAKATMTTDPTTSHAIKGTVRYMAPEMVDAKTEIDRRADVFACGVVLWELVTGRPLWEGLNPLQILRRLANGDIPSLVSMDPMIPAEVGAICRRAMAADPDARQWAADELREDIEAFLHEQPGPLQASTLAALVTDHYREEREQRAQAIRARLTRKDTEPLRVHVGDTLPMIWTPTTGPGPPAPAVAAWWRHAKWVAGGAILVGVAVAWPMIGGLASDRPPAAADAKAEAPAALAAPAADEPSVGAAPTTPDVGATGASTDRVEMRVAATPPSASLYLDGEPLQGNPAVISIERGDAAHHIEARAEGYETKTALVVPVADRAIVLELSPARPSKPKDKPPGTKAKPSKPKDRLEIERKSPYGP